MIFHRDPYNTLTPHRWLELADHGTMAYEGSTGIKLTRRGPVLAAFGRVGPAFWFAGVTPGHDVFPGDDEPLDYAVRAAYDIREDLAVGAFAYYGVILDESTLRAAVDLNAWTSFGAIKAVVLYDTLDAALAEGLGWDLVIPRKRLSLQPLARVDTVYVDGEAEVDLTGGFGVIIGTGRLWAEATAGLDGSASGGLQADVLF